MRRSVMLSFAVLLSLVSMIYSGEALANSRQAYRETIRSMPLLERPNRFGHIYGNTVRRIYHRRYGALPGQESPAGLQVPQLPLPISPGNVQ